jgi:hypothetical protein
VPRLYEFLFPRNAKPLRLIKIKNKLLLEEIADDYEDVIGGAEYADFLTVGDGAKNLPGPQRM